MKKLRKVNRTNYVPSKGQKLGGESKTIQDDALSVAQLLRQHINGIPVSQRNGQFIEDADHDDIDGEKFFKSDLAERDEVINGMKEMSNRLKGMESEYNEEMKKRAKQPKKEEKTPEEKL